MALMKKKFSDIPSDAVILSEDEALKYQLDVVKGWKKQEDVWVFNYGHTVLASLSALSAIYINNHYRVRFRLLNYGRFSSYLPVVAIPSLVSGIFHQQFVVTDVLLQKSCPVCVEVRSAAFQVLFSTIFPTILAPLAALPFAIRYNTYSVPPVTREPYKVFQMLLRHAKPLWNTLYVVMALQGLAASLLTYQEMNSIQDIYGKLNSLEERLEEKYGEKKFS